MGGGKGAVTVPKGRPVETPQMPPMRDHLMLDQLDLAPGTEPTAPNAAAIAEAPLAAGPNAAPETTPAAALAAATADTPEATPSPVQAPTSARRPEPSCVHAGRRPEPALEPAARRPEPSCVHAGRRPEPALEPATTSAT